jgi:hypothetical protein
VKIFFRAIDGGKSLEFTLNANDPLASLPIGKNERADCLNLYLSVTPDLKLRTINKYVETYDTKTDGVTYWAQIQEPILAQIYIPFADSNLDEISFRFNSFDDVGYDAKNFEFRGEVEHTLEGFHAVIEECLPSIRVASITDVDGKYSVIAQLTMNGQDVHRSGVRLFAKSATGYIPVREGYTDSNGQFVFNAKRLDLIPTDQMVMEIGFKFRTNVSNISIGEIL